MKKRFISTVLCAAMAASLVTGCGSGSGNASGGSTQAAADTGSKKEVVIWDYFETDAQKAMMTTLLDGFNASQDEYVASHVYVPFSDYEKQLTLGIASGELPTWSSWMAAPWHPLYHWDCSGIFRMLILNGMNT